MASKRRIKKAMCGKKVKYSNQGDAAAALSSLYRRTGYVGRTYRCPWCGKWHFGKTER